MRGLLSMTSVAKLGAVERPRASCVSMWWWSDPAARANWQRCTSPLRESRWPASAMKTRLLRYNRTGGRSHFFIGTTLPGEIYVVLNRPNEAIPVREQLAREAPTRDTRLKISRTLAYAHVTRADTSSASAVLRAVSLFEDDIARAVEEMQRDAKRRPSPIGHPNDRSDEMLSRAVSPRGIVTVKPGVTMPMVFAASTAAGLPAPSKATVRTIMQAGSAQLPAPLQRRRIEP
jgi:hypothetical protein